MLKTEDLLKIAIEARRKFETGKVKASILKNLYSRYNPLEDTDTFIQSSRKLFPKLNCGLTTLYLRELIGNGTVTKGKYKGINHTFLMIKGNIIVDITADQYGGPKIYVGPLKKPWEVKN